MSAPSHGRSRPPRYHKSSSHRRPPSSLASGPAAFHCLACQAAFSSLKQAEDHLIGKKHIKSLQRYGLSAPSSSSSLSLSKAGKREAKWLEKLPNRMRRNLTKYREFWLPLVKAEFQEELNSAKERMLYFDLNRLVSRGDALVNMNASKQKMKEYNKKSKNEQTYAFSVASKPAATESADSFQLGSLGLSAAAPTFSRESTASSSSWSELPAHEVLPGDLIFISKYDANNIVKRQRPQKKSRANKNTSNSFASAGIQKNIISIPQHAKAAPAPAPAPAPVLDINETIMNLLSQGNIPNLSHSSSPLDVTDTQSLLDSFSKSLQIQQTPAQTATAPTSAAAAAQEADDSGSDSDSDSDSPLFIEAVCVQRNRTYLVLAIDPEAQPELFDDSDDSDSSEEEGEELDEEEKAAKAAKAAKPPKVLSQATQALLADIAANRGPFRLDRGPSKVGHDRMKEAIQLITGSKFPGHDSLREILCRLKPTQDNAATALLASNEPAYQGWVETRTRDNRNTYYYHSLTGERTWTRPAVDESALISVAEYQRRFQEGEARRREAAQREREKQEDYAMKAEANRMAPTLAEQQAVANALANMTQLNDSQRMAILSCLSNRCSLIQGPPGTGKTTTCVALLTIWTQILKRKPILAAAYSNIGVDQLMGGMIANGLKAVRIGQIDKVTDELRDCSLSVLTERHSDMPAVKADIESIKAMQTRLNNLPMDTGDAMRLKKEIAARWKAVRDKEDKIQQDIMKNCDVVCATCIGAGFSGIGNMTFPLVVVDECTQATEPSTLIPLVQSSDAIILIGDQAQLGPSVFNGEKNHPLRISLFDRMLGLETFED